MPNIADEALCVDCGAITVYWVDTYGCTYPAELCNQVYCLPCFKKRIARDRYGRCDNHKERR